MTDHRVTETTTTTTGAPMPQTTVVERRSGSGAGLLIGLALLIAVVVGAFFLMNQSRNETIQTDAIAGAAEKVGESASQVGDAAQDAVTPGEN
jgi:hypothetical protein